MKDDMKEKLIGILSVLLLLFFAIVFLPWACSPDYSFEPDYKLGAPRY